ncbi:sensor histidine kinase [Spirosoma luteum]|uniref:sensor histidine kinase n=1 Tax=Spirosoma luteum TaxID=431553 RepID=UPI00035D17E8|nr:HAMP domain-containing sensor histidine kinase [Spirosoma luteum]
MSIIPPGISQPLAELVSYFFTRREVILQNWRTACEEDLALSKISSLSREEFNNLLPIILDILEQRLLRQTPEADPVLMASLHGLQRWQRAYALPETLRELNHLTRILYQELQLFQELIPQANASMLLQVQQQISQLMSETILSSVQKYDELQRLEAVNRVSTLREAIDQMQELSRQRSDMLRTSSHDLRGSFGLVNSAAHLLNTKGLNEQDREQFQNILNRNLGNIKSILNNLMALSRLEAGEELLRIEPVDVGKLLTELVTDAQVLANDRGLILQANGPDTLVLETDAAKLQRIVQNLLMNALTYTPAGFISVSWSKSDNNYWLVSVQDSGPGLPAGLTSLLASQLKPVTEATSATGIGQPEPSVMPASDEQHIPPGPELANRANQGEGVGLQIVKRLCDLLDAKLEIETHTGRGTLFRIRLSIHQAG